MRLLLGLATAALLITTAAHAGEWCGFVDKDHAPIRCGYSSLGECQHALIDKKGAYCMRSPSFAQAPLPKPQPSKRPG